MSRKTRPETPNAFARMTAALKLPEAANALPVTPEIKPEPAPKAAARPSAATRIEYQDRRGTFSEVDAPRASHSRSGGGANHAANS